MWLPHGKELAFIEFNLAKKQKGNRQTKIFQKKQKFYQKMEFSGRECKKVCHMYTGYLWLCCSVITDVH